MERVSCCRSIFQDMSEEELIVCKEMTYQESPKFMAPIHSGLTLTEAEGESKRCLPRMDFGGGAGSMMGLRLPGTALGWDEWAEKVMQRPFGWEDSFISSRETLLAPANSDITDVNVYIEMYYIRYVREVPRTNCKPRPPLLLLSNQRICHGRQGKRQNAGILQCHG